MVIFGNKEFQQTQLCAPHTEAAWSLPTVVQLSCTWLCRTLVPSVQQNVPHSATAAMAAVAAVAAVLFIDVLNMQQLVCLALRNEPQDFVSG